MEGDPLARHRVRHKMVVVGWGLDPALEKRDQWQRDIPHDGQVIGKGDDRICAVTRDLW